MPQKRAGRLIGCRLAGSWGYARGCAAACPQKAGELVKRVIRPYGAIPWPRQRPARRVLAVRATLPLTQAAKARQRANFAGSRGRLNRKPPVASPLPCRLPWLPSGGVALPGGEVGMFGGLAGIGFTVLLRLVAFQQKPCGGVFDAVAP